MAPEKERNRIIGGQWWEGAGTFSLNSHLGFTSITYPEITIKF